ncbi:hypothetical protein [Jiulongibacter sediminis]|uniref:hypothetical protein n=1 Tax=Jiulongibacter sediminis TaxID=1605367 RepID=UPI0012FE18C9|nr:hypothetical protein [Jiulongibacter sediminis]
MNLLTISSCLVMIVIAFMVVREAIRKPVIRPRKKSGNKEIREKFRQLNQMAAQIKV